MFGPNSSGAILVETGSNVIATTTAEGTANNSASFLASRANVTYGASDTVQPSSLQCLVLVRAF